MIKNFFLVFLSSIIALIFIEIFSRYYIYNSLKINDSESELYKSHELYGWVFNEGTHQIFRAGNKVDITINKDGFRGGSINKKIQEDRENIMFIGDSATAGVQVGDKKTFSALTSSLFENKYNAFNFGVDGFASDQAYLVLSEYIDIINPKYVFFTFVVNDLEFLFENEFSHGCCAWGKPYFDENFKLHKKKFDKIQVVENNPNYINSVKKLLRENFVIYRLIAKIKHSVVGFSGCAVKGYNDEQLIKYANLNNLIKLGSNQYLIELQEDYIKRWERFELILSNMKQLTDKYSAKLIVINFKEPFHAHQKIRNQAQECSNYKLDFNYVSEKLEDITKKLNITFLDNTFNDVTNFQNENNCTINFMSKSMNVVDGHYTECGHKLHYSKIKKYLTDLQ